MKFNLPSSNQDPGKLTDSSTELNKKQSSDPNSALNSSLDRLINTAHLGPFLGAHNTAPTHNPTLKFSLPSLAPALSSDFNNKQSFNSAQSSDLDRLPNLAPTPNSTQTPTPKPKPRRIAKPRRQLKAKPRHKFIPTTTSTPEKFAAKMDLETSLSPMKWKPHVVNYCLVHNITDNELEISSFLKKIRTKQDFNPSKKWSSDPNDI